MLTEGNRAEERRKWSNDWPKRKTFLFVLLGMFMLNFTLLFVLLQGN